MTCRSDTRSSTRLRNNRTPARRAPARTRKPIPKAKAQEYCGFPVRTGWPWRHLALRFIAQQRQAPGGILQCKIRPRSHFGPADPARTRIESRTCKEKKRGAATIFSVRFHDRQLKAPAHYDRAKKS